MTHRHPSGRERRCTARIRTTFLPIALLYPLRLRNKKKTYLQNGWPYGRAVQAFLVWRKKAHIARTHRPARINISSSSRCRQLAKKYFRLTHGSPAASHFNLPFFVDSACFASKHAPVRSIDSITSEITRIYVAHAVPSVIMLSSRSIGSIRSAEMSRAGGILSLGNRATV